jgi:hypothetical protein
VLSSGSFIVDASDGATRKLNLFGTVQGMGMDQTTIYVGYDSDVTNAAAAVALGSSGYGRISDMSIDVWREATGSDTGTGYAWAMEAPGEFVLDNLRLGCNNGDVLRLQGSRVAVRSGVMLYQDSDTGTDTLGNGIRVDGGSVGHVIEPRLMTDIGKHGVLLEQSASRCQVKGIYFANVGIATDDTYDAVHLEDGGVSVGDYTKYNVVDDIVVRGTATNKHRHAVYLGGDQMVGNTVGAVSSEGHQTSVYYDRSEDTVILAVEEVPFLFEGALSAVSGVLPHVVNGNQELLEVRAACDTAPSGSAAVFDVNNGASSVFPTATNPQIAASANVGVRAYPDNPLFSDGDLIRVDVDTPSSAEDAVVLLRLAKV